MPWRHCGRDLVDTVRRCPKCSFAKASWTVRRSRTALFKLQGPWLEVQLVGMDDRPIPGEAYRIELTDGRVLEGDLDAGGAVRVRRVPRAPAVVSFPRLDMDAWEPIDGSAEDAAAPHATTGTWRTVAPGECTSSIAYQAGLFPGTVWDHPLNEDLRTRRDSLNVLRPGDRLFVPDIRAVGRPCAASARHVFRRRGVPERVRVRFDDAAGAPRAGVPYRFEAAGATRAGATDDEGFVDEFVPPDLRRAVLTLLVEGAHEVYELDLGHLPPISELEGVQARLTSLGYPCDAEGGTLGPLTRRRLREFQGRAGLAVTGEPDDLTRQALVARYGT